MLRAWLDRSGIVMDERDSGPYSGASPMDYDAELRLLNDVLHRA